MSVLVAARQSSDPEAMEAVACHEGLALASDLGLHSFRVASDCVKSLLVRSSTDMDRLSGR